MTKNFHLSYCTNIHAYTTLAELLQVLDEQVAEVVSSVLSPVSAGLYLSNQVVNELYKVPENMKRLADALQKNALYVCTLNCFPYGEFHDQVIKKSVYYPDWGNQDRLEYTKKAGWILDQLLPDGVVGTISTVPITYGKELPEGTFDHLKEVLHYFSTALTHTVYLALEPEPDCYLDDTQSCLQFFEMAKEILPALSFNHLGLCFDTCHFSVIFEDPKTSYQKLKNHGVLIPKIQVSASLVTSEPLKLEKFSEPIYLHQTSVWDNKNIYRFPDLDKALSCHYFTTAEWRVHFHVPIYLEFTREGLGTTRNELVLFLNILKPEHQIHIEVETYSLAVIPGLKISAVESTIRELNFLTHNLNKVRSENE